MTEGNFVDYAKIHLISGNGGKGSSHLRREKYIPKGGRMAEMEEEVEILYLRLILICGLF